MKPIKVIIEVFKPCFIEKGKAKHTDTAYSNRLHTTIQQNKGELQTENLSLNPIVFTINPDSLKIFIPDKKGLPEPLVRKADHSNKHALSGPLVVRGSSFPKLELFLFQSRIEKRG